MSIVDLSDQATDSINDLNHNIEIKTISNNPETKNNEYIILDETTYTPENYDRIKQEAINFLLDHKDDPSLKIHHLAYEGKYEEIENIAEIEWIAVEFIIYNDLTKHIIIGQEKWPIIDENSVYFIAKTNEGQATLGKKITSNKFSISKSLKPVLQLKQNALGKTPLYYSILGECIRGYYSQITSFLLLFFATENLLDQIYHLQDSIYNEIVYLHFINKNVNDRLYDLYIPFFIKEIFRKDDSKTLELMLKNSRFSYALIDFINEKFFLIKSNSLKCSEIAIELCASRFDSYIKSINHAQKKKEIIEAKLKDLSINPFTENYSKVLKDYEQKNQFYQEKIYGRTSRFSLQLKCIQKLMNYNFEILIEVIKMKIIPHINFYPMLTQIIKTDFSSLLSYVIKNDSFNMNFKRDEDLILVAINSKATGCINILFEDLLQKLNKNADIDIELLENIENNIVNYLKAPSSYLKELFSYMIHKKSIKLNQVKQNKVIYHMIDDLSKKDDVFKYSLSNERHSNAKLYSSLVRLPSVFGSTKSIDFLKNLEMVEDLKLFNFKLIRQYISYKWNQIWHIIIIQNIFLLSYIPIFMIFINAEVNYYNTSDDYNYISKYILLIIIIALIELQHLCRYKSLNYFEKEFFNHFIVLIFLTCFGINQFIFITFDPYNFSSYIDLNFHFGATLIFFLIGSLYKFEIPKYLKMNNQSDVYPIYSLPAVLSLFKLSSEIPYYANIIISGVLFISLFIAGTKSNLNQLKFRLFHSFCKCYICIFFLDEKLNLFKFFVHFEIFHLTSFLIDILTIRNTYIKRLHFLVDASLLLALTIGLIFVENIFIWIIIIAIYFIGFYIDLRYCSVKSLDFKEMNQSIIIFLLFLGFENMSKNFIINLIIPILDIGYVAFLYHCEVINPKKILNILFDRRTIDLAISLIFFIWVISLVFQTHSLLLLYILFALSCIKSLTVFYLFQRSRYWICLIKNSLKNILSFKIRFNELKMSYPGIELKEMTSILLTVESTMFFKRNQIDNGLFLVACEPFSKRIGKTKESIHMNVNDKITYESSKKIINESSNEEKNTFIKKNY